VLAEIERHRGEDEVARQLWERSAALAGSQIVHQRLAEWYREHGDDERAQRHSARARYHAGVESLRADRIPAAMEHLRAAVERDTELTHAWYLLGEALRAAGDEDEAEAAYRRCIALAPRHGRALDALERLAR